MGCSGEGDVVPVRGPGGTRLDTTIRSPNSRAEWTDADLEACNIKLTFPWDAQTFFGETALPAPSVGPEFLTALTADDALTDSAYTLLAQLDLAMMPTPPLSEPEEYSDDSAIVDFAVALFHSLGYIHRPRAIRTRKALRLLVSGEWKYARPDVCIVDRDTNDVVLAVKEDRREVNSHAQLIAQAIAAFQNNNARRRAGARFVNPGILLHGTSPTFFKIPITLALSRCVELGQHPPTSAPTIVTAHVPDVPRPHRRFSEGMKPLDSRRVILECYDAFKKYVT
ncbi:unnamed protein product [Cyclocybe aegerita]|uniref:Uncharacterized protein n=1 Tax=Cyclocybe aegerita TaxID=1973307 RepID=A0A8S0W9M9_CYCAE|nr:unnamed protein product [Cyclocybe aegerita]